MKGSSAIIRPGLFHNERYASHNMYPFGNAEYMMLEEYGCFEGKVSMPKEGDDRYV